MSGEISMLLLLPMALPLAVGSAAVSAAEKAGKAAVKAARTYEEKRREERELIRRSGIAKEITSFRTSAKELMNGQREQNKKLSEAFEENVRKNRDVFVQQTAYMIETPDAFRKVLVDSSTKMTEDMNCQQQKLQNSYRNEISQAFTRIEKENSKKMEALTELLSLYGEGMEKQEALQKIASAYLADADDLLKSLQLDFSGEKYLGEKVVALHADAWEKAREQYEKKNYEGCLIAVTSLMAKLQADILTTDEKHQEFENWQKTALMLIAENKEMMESMCTLSEEFYKKLAACCVEQDQTFTLREELIGLDLTPFWGMTREGKSVYAAMLDQLDQLEKSILDEACTLTAGELREIAEAMAGEWRGEIADRIQKVIIRLNNALQRESLGRCIMAELEDMGYTYKNYRYLRTGADGQTEETSDEDLDAQLCITFEDLSEDEILIELGNQNDSGIDLQITDMAEELDPEVDKSESRREMEQVIRSIVEGSVPERGLAQIRGGCRAGTEHRVVTNDVNRRKKYLVDH